MKITHIIETHVHADHVSGNRELKFRTEGYISDSSHVPMSDILAGSLFMPKDEEVILVCGICYRVDIVASRIKHDRSIHLHSLAGGLTAWQNAGYSLAA
ncbi:MAG: MBL fold metallo-hydrolase [Desulfobacterales bacterium]